MDIKVTGRKMSVTPALKEHVENKITEAVKVFNVEPMTCDVLLKAEHYKGESKNSVCEVTLRAHGISARVEASKTDMYAAIDEAARMIARQLRKHKTKIIDKRNAGQGLYNDITANDVALEDPVLADEALLDDSDK